MWIPGKDPRGRILGAAGSTIGGWKGAVAAAGRITGADVGGGYAGTTGATMGGADFGVLDFGGARLRPPAAGVFGVPRVPGVFFAERDSFSFGSGGGAFATRLALALTGF